MLTNNRLFIGGETVGRTAAILCTIIECACRRRMNPFEVLRDLLTRLPRTTNRQLAELLPPLGTPNGKPPPDPGPTAHDRHPVDVKRWSA